MKVQFCFGGVYLNTNSVQSSVGTEGGGHSAYGGGYDGRGGEGFGWSPSSIDVYDMDYSTTLNS